MKIENILVFFFQSFAAPSIIDTGRITFSAFYLISIYYKALHEHGGFIFIECFLFDS